MSTALRRRTDKDPRDEAKDDVEKNIREIFDRFTRGEINELQAAELLEKARRSRHNALERYMTFLAK